MICEYCHASPHLPGCPNEPDPEPVRLCAACGEGIYAGDEYYEIDDNDYCEECIRGCKKEA